MGRPLFDLLGLHDGIVTQLNATVADYIDGGVWNFPYMLHLHFPGLCDFVHQQVPISINTHAVDTLIWMPSSSGVLTAKEAYKFLRPSLPSLDWSKVIWCKHVAPRMSLLVWKVLRGRVISEDFLQK